MIGKFSDQKQVGLVSTFDALIAAKFTGEMNAICWQRELIGDFEELVSKLQLKENITVISTEELLAISLSPQGIIARDVIVSDLKLLASCGTLPTLNLIKAYERDDELGFISTDVYSYHVDRSPIATDTFLCTYYGTASDILPNEQVQQKILIPEIRQKLRDLYKGAEVEFESFLEECFFDLHYQAKPNAIPLNLGIGHLWKLAVDYPEQQVLPCVHRAPKENDGEYRLLLIC